MLRAFADDIVCIVKNKKELTNVIKSFEELMNKFNIHINKKKTQYVAKVKEETHQQQRWKESAG